MWIYKVKHITQEELNDESKKEALKNLEDLRNINENYIDYYLPCIPETSIKI